MTGNNDGRYRDVLRDDESLATFMRAMKDFDAAFSKAMCDGADYTLKLEIHGSSGKLIHCRVMLDNFNRPRGLLTKVNGERTLKKRQLERSSMEKT